MADPEALADLNRIMHPEVHRRRLELLAEARARGDRIVVSDIPLLFEADRPDGVRRRGAGGRARSRCGGPGCWPSAASTPEEADRMIGAQLPSSAKRARSDYVIDNDGDRATLERWRPDGVEGAARARLTSPSGPPILPRATTYWRRRCRTYQTICVYTAEHEYVARTGDPAVVRVGITDYAQGELGDVVFVQPSQARRQPRCPPGFRHDRGGKGCLRAVQPRGRRGGGGQRRPRERCRLSSTATPTARAGWSSSGSRTPTISRGSCHRGAYRSHIGE